MQTDLPDYFIALMKQYAGLLNDDQARRATMAVSEVLEGSLAPTQESQFFAMVPSYLRPRKQTFFARIGTNSKGKKRSASASRQLRDRLQLTSREETEVVFTAYFRAIRTVIDPTTAITLTRILPPELVRLYAA